METTVKRNWKIILSAAFLTAILAFLMWNFRPSRLILVYSPPLCNIRTEKVIETLIKRDFSGSRSSFFTPMIAGVMAVNDMRCEAEYMANFGIILENGPKTSFGIFHIHFSRAETFISSAAVTSWKQYQGRNDPKIDAAWQDFIQKVYPEKMNPTHN